jgi:hypothetical protein
MAPVEVGSAFGHRFLFLCFSRAIPDIITTDADWYVVALN